MLRQDYNRQNAYFTTYHVYDTEKKKYVGIIEDHDRGVKHRYFVGWKFENNTFLPGSFQPGKTKSFDTYAAALEYIQEDFNK